MDLENFGEALSFEIAFFMQGLDNPDTPLHEKGDNTNKLIHQIQALAIIVLLVRGQSDNFYHNLIRAALLRKKFLEAVKDQKDVYHQCSGRIQGFLSAVAAQDFDLAREIVNLTPPQFQKQMEYEDDYCYGQLLYHLAAKHLNSNQIKRLKERYEELCGETPRLAIINAILNKDLDAFNEAFEELILEHEELIEADKKRGQLEEPEVMAHRSVYLEGIALINLASGHSIHPQNHFRYCPPNALVAMSAPFPGE